MAHYAISEFGRRQKALSTHGPSRLGQPAHRVPPMGSLRRQLPYLDVPCRYLHLINTADRGILAVCAKKREEGDSEYDIPFNDVWMTMLKGQIDA